MAVIKPRTRVVFFRVSEEEFREMEMACPKVGARSISDFARVAARRCLKDSGIDQLNVLLEKLAVFEQTLDELQIKVQAVHEGREGHMQDRTQLGADESRSRQ